MMKNNLKICFSILLSITMILCMSSCGKSNKYEFSDESDDYLMKDDSESKNSMEAKKILDLNGSWVEEGEEGGESYQAGYIENGVIEMFWMSEGGNTASLYWSGTYEAPTSPSDEYSWNSVNDKNSLQIKSQG